VGRSLTTRRTLLRSCAALAALGGWPTEQAANALGRTPVGGKLALMLPWPVSSIDPHDIFDPGGALFGHAVFDSLFAFDASGEPYPTLAADAPFIEGGKTILRLREGMMTSKGRKLDGRDVIASISRARHGAGLAWWSDLPTPTPHPKDPLAIVFANADPALLARTLSSPLFALVPRSFEPANPDGTGAMSAETSVSRMVLRRNPNAARGASFLDEITIEQAPDLLTPLRSFQGNLTDVGWLSSGLHTPRPGAQPFDLGSAAWIVLQTGAEVGPWGAPGIAQRLLDGLPSERLERFGLGALPPATGAAEWGGPPCDLLVLEGSAYLVELARTVSSLLSRPGHEVTVRGVSSVELASRRKSGTYHLLLGVVRPFGAPGVATLVALASAVDPASAREIMRRPPRLTTFEPRVLTRTLKLGVLGELRVAGAHAPDVHLAKNVSGEGWDLGSAYRVGT